MTRVASARSQPLRESWRLTGISCAFPAFAAAALVLGGCATTGARSGRAPEAHAAAGDDVRAVLDQQVAAWNRGDIDGFMATYWNSDELTFSGAGQTRRGWGTVRARYQAHYPTRERMGQLAFSELEIRLLGDQAALVLGRWRLTDTPEAAGGVFTLVLQRISGRWFIVHDHTSAAPAAGK